MSNNIFFCIKQIKLLKKIKQYNEFNTVIIQSGH